MKASWINTTHIEGLLYDHSLERKVSGEKSKNPGTEFITGSINIATDNNCHNVVQVHFTYVTATTSKGGANNTYNVLSKILDGANCVVKDGKEQALKLKIDSAVDVNEWFKDLKDANPIATRRNEGGFVHIIDELNADEKTRNTFKTDMIITNTRDVEAVPEKDLPAKLVLSGYIFNFRKALLPVEFSVVDPNGIKHFQRMDCSPNQPIVTQVWGRQVSQSIKTEIVEESAFGENSVRIRESSVRDFVVTGTSKETYVWDDESTITATEMKQLLQDREIHLATIKKNQEDYQNNSKKGSTAPVISTANSGYNF